MACVEIPDIEGFEPVKDDYTAGFANGVEAVRDWLRRAPLMDTRKAASILDDLIEVRR